MTFSAPLRKTALCAAVLLALRPVEAATAQSFAHRLPAKTGGPAASSRTSQQGASVPDPVASDGISGASAVIPKPTGNNVTSATAAPDAQPTSAADGSIALQQQIAKMPLLRGTGINVGSTQTALLKHLNAIVTFYRLAVSPVQKVGEPSDLLYREQAASQALQTAQLAFTAAENMAALLSKIAEQPAQPSSSATTAHNGQLNDAQRFADARTQIQAQLTQLQQQDATLRDRIDHAQVGDLPALRQQQERLEGGIALQQATVEALDKIGSFSEAQKHTGLAEDIDRLQRSAPELAAKGGKPAPLPSVQSLQGEHAGVMNQATTLFQLLAARQSIDTLIKNADDLRQQATNLREPVLAILRSTFQQGQALSQQSVDQTGTATLGGQDAAAMHKQFDQLTATFQVLAETSLPLSQEVILLEGERAALTTWRTAVDSEYKLILRSLLLRVFGIVFAFAILAIVSKVWASATVRYVHDLRRRRLLIVVRRVVIGFLTGLIGIFGFVTQFSSIATFAGFLTAGIAVGLQSILLSIAAFFFIVGRYGVRVGDRITVSGVTGDVVEVGLVRFYLMELAGTGTELHPTGRVAVFANSVLFQTGTPLYKQMPGTDYAWHELTAKLKPNADARLATDSVLRAINEVYETYHARVAQQHRQVEDWMGTPIEAPKVTPRLQLMESGLQLAVLFPVEINSAAETDQRIAESLLRQLGENGPLRDAVDGTPVVKATIK